MVLYSYWQMRGDYKIKFTDKLKANIWIHSDLAKGHCLKELTSPYIVSYLHFLNLNNILTLPKISLLLKLRLIWHNLCLPCFFLPARFMHMRTSSQSQNKCKLSVCSIGKQNPKYLKKHHFHWNLWVKFFWRKKSWTLKLDIMWK